MIRIFATLILILLLSCIWPVSAQEQLESRVYQDELNGVVYYYFVPAGYSAQRPLPMIIALHQSGGSGKDFIHYWLAPAEKKYFLVVAPDAREKTQWLYREAEDVFAVIKRLGAQYRIDPERIYITGFSSGANFTYYLGLNYPEHFRAAAAYAGTFRRLEPKLSITQDAQKHIPFYILHGTMDNLADISDSQCAQQVLLKNGYSVKYRELSGTDHVMNEDIAWLIVNWFSKE